jgi:O-antigen/teichoic acid export membrane protein
MGALALASAPNASERSALQLVAFFSRCGLIASGMLCVAAPLLIRLLYGSGHRMIISLAIILSLFLPLRFLNFALSSLALARGWATKRLYVVLFSAVLNVSLNLLLDPWAGSLGAAWATVLTEVGVAVVFLSLLGRERLSRAAWPVFIAVGIACGAQLVRLFMVHDEWLGVATGVLLGLGALSSFQAQRSRVDIARISA